MCSEPRRETILFLSNDVVYLFRFRGPLISEMISRGYDVVAVAPPGSGVHEDNLRRLGATFHPWNVQKNGRNVIGELRSLFGLAAIIRQFRPEIFFGYTVKPVTYGLTVSRLLGVPRRVGMITGLGYAFLPGVGLKRTLVRAVAQIAYWIALRQADAVIFQNRDDLELFRQRRLLPVGAKATVVNGSGVDMTAFPLIPIPQGPPVFLMVARLLVDKGVHEFVAAARLVKAEIPAARFVLVGTGDTNPEAVPQRMINDWVAEGIITAPGHVEDPAQYYAECHVFVLPSYREGTPRTNLEAMATGRAIITTDVPGCRETVVPGVNGLLVPARDAPQLAEAMLALAREPSRVSAMGQAGRQLCETRFELEQVTVSTADTIVPNEHLQ